MKRCPICKNADRSDIDPRGDYRIVDCARCGEYKITGTALAMLEGRQLNMAALETARLSHQIRRRQTGDSRPEVTTLNLEELVGTPLPDIPNQLLNLLRWMQSKIKDDHLGSVEFVDREALAGMVGTLDEQRVNLLIELALKRQLIDYVPDDEYRIAEAGWKALQPMEAASTSEDSERHAEETEAVRVHANCNNCGGQRQALIRAEYSLPGSDGPVSWATTVQILECGGCQRISVKKVYWFSEWDEIGHDEFGEMVFLPGEKVEYWPAPTVRKKPQWIDLISDENLRELIDELYTALDADLPILAAICSRTIFDRASTILVGDIGGFEQKLDKMEEGGFIGETERDMLQVLADAGSASAHRGFKPKPKHLEEMLNILEGFLHRTFVQRDVIHEIKQAVPARKKKR